MTAFLSALVFKPGADPGFSNRGGANNYVHAAHITIVKSGQGQGSLKGPGKFRVLDALSLCYLSLLLNSDTKRDLKIKVGQNLEGARACCAPLWIRHCKLFQ